MCQLLLFLDGRGDGFRGCCLNSPRRVTAASFVNGTHCRDRAPVVEGMNVSDGGWVAFLMGCLVQMVPGFFKIIPSGP